MANEPQETPIPVLEREIARLKQAAADRVLRGDAEDYATYKYYVARYHVLDELTRFTDERKTKGDTLDEE